MRASARRFVAAAGVLAMAMSASAVSIEAAATGGMAGRIVAVDGAPAAGYEVVLLDGAGDLVATAATSRSGGYAFEGVARGSYRLGVRDPQGRLAPVLGASTRVIEGASTRHDVRLSQGAGPRLAPAVYGSDSWWNRQTRNQKIFWVVGIAVGAAAVWAVVDSQTDDEAPASGFR